MGSKLIQVPFAFYASKFNEANFYVYVTFGKFVSKTDFTQTP